MKRLLTLALVLCMVVSTFAACSQAATTNPQNPNNPGTPANPADPNASNTITPHTPILKEDGKYYDKWGREWVDSALPAELDFGEAKVNILVEKGRMSEVWAEAMNDELINDSIYERNLRVESELNVKLNFIESANGQTALASEIGTIVTAGTKDYDIAMGYAYFMVSGVRSYNYANLYDVPNLDLTKPWWNQDYVKEATLADQLYTITGDLSLSTTTGTGCMFFNKKLADEEYADLGGSDYLYQLVLDGKWTMDKFTELVKDKYRDLDGDGVPSDGDFFGYGNWLSGPTPCDPFAFGMGAFITEDDANGIPQLVWNRQHTVDALHKLFVLCNDSDGVYYKPGTNPGFYNNNEAHAMLQNKFISGTMIFNTVTLGSASSFVNMKDDYGLLPMPKFDEAQTNYYTTTADGYLLIMIPAGIEEDENRAPIAGATLELLGEESYRTVAPNYFEVVMKYRYIRSEDDTDYDLQMYDLILNGNSFNFGLIYSNTMSNPSFAFRHLVGRDGTENFASYWGQMSTQATRQFNSLVNWFVEE